MHRFSCIVFSCCLPWGLACTPAPPITVTSPPVSDIAAFGDSIDNAAWEAIGPRPTNARRLPVAPIRLVDYWQIDRWERMDRMGVALSLNFHADKILTSTGSAPLDMYLDAIRTAPLLLAPWMQSTRILIQRQEILRAYALARQYQRMAPPENGGPWYLLGNCQAQLNQPKEAIRSLEKSIRLGSTDSTEAVVALCLVHLQEGNITAAESLQTVFDIQDPVLKLLTRANRERRAGNLRLAVELLEEASADPNAPIGAWAELASTLVELEDYGRAEATYKLMLKRSPGSSAAVIGLARVELAQNKFAAADERLTALTKQQPENLVAHFNLGTAVLEQVRRALVKVEHLQRADESFSRCIHGDFQMEAALWGRAESRLRRKLLRTAYADAKQAQSLSPNVGSAITRWARIQLHAGFEKETKRTLRNAAKNDQLDREGLALLRTLEDKSGANTISELRYLFRKHPDDWPNGMRLGTALLASGELKEAEEVLRAVVALQPENPTALQNLAAVLDRRKKYREAQALLIRADSLR